MGDGRWDVEAARELDLPFVGIGDRDRMRAWGAREVSPDLQDPESFIRLLEEAGLVEPTAL